VPRYTGAEARWESFRRWLVLRIRTLKPDDFLVLSVSPTEYVQFINEGGNLLGECSDPEMLAGGPTTLSDPPIQKVGWGPKSPGSGSPNFRAQWFPTYVPEPTPEAPWTPDLDDALDAADLTVRTLREVFGVLDPGDVSLDGGQSMTVTSLDAELGSLFPGEDD
jgi:hypothetical protein